MIYLIVFYLYVSGVKEGSSATGAKWRRKAVVVRDEHGDVTVKLWDAVADTDVRVSQCMKFTNVETSMFRTQKHVSIKQSKLRRLCFFSERNYVVLQSTEQVGRRHLDMYV